MVVERAGFVLLHQSFLENSSFDEPHLTELVKYFSLNNSINEKQKSNKQ